ncbi:hypothetical protein [Planctomicrobium sp. SH664]|uniref:hypothetical protein n=1 Tax=Planctomicrobium sp. SH664 TaxID=3448125 RepID=UPI003F5B3FB7
MTASPPPADIVLPVCRRHDLVIVSNGPAGAPRWTVKDPLSLQFFQLGEADHFVFSQLDGQITLSELQERFHGQFAPRVLSAQQLLAFIQQLWGQGLLTVNRFGLSTELLARQTESRQQTRRGFWKNLLAIRFPGINPDPLLSACLPFVGWMFSRTAVLCTLTLMISAVVLAANESETLLREIPQAANIFRADRLLWLMLTIGVIKILHELGHALTCKKLGGACRELGLMLLVLTPCLYCNVSDSWLFRSRWQRAAVSGAGMYVELFLASLCTFLWRYSVPGLFHALCLDVMLICSVNTLLLNGNPLLRYDGYYLLADLVDIPNLRSRSMNLARSFWTRIFFGVTLPAPQPVSGLPRVAMTFYGIASWVYGWLLLVGILWMLYRLAAAQDLQSVVLAVAPLLVGGRIVETGRQWGRMTEFLKRDGQFRPRRFAAAVVAVTALLALLLAWPFPKSLRAPVRVVAAERQPVFVTSPGQLHLPNRLRAGKEIRQGELLAVLTNPEIERDIARLQGEVARARKRVEHLEGRQYADPQASSQLPSARAALADVEERLARRTEDAGRLRLTAPQGGMLLGGEQPASTSRSDLRLQREGEPFQPQNEGAWLEAGLPFCVIGNATAREAVFYVDQAEAATLKPGAAAEFTVPQLGGTVLQGKVVEVAVSPVVQIPDVLAHSQAIPGVATGRGGLQPLAPLHEVRVQFAHPDSVLAVDQPGWGRIDAGRESLFTRGLRAVRRTMTFDL